MKKKIVNFPLAILLILIFLSWSIIGLSSCKKNQGDQASQKERKAEKQSQPGISPKATTEKNLEDIKEAKKLVITSLPQDGGYIKAQDQPLYIYFSQPINADDFSFEINPDVGGWSIDWQRQKRIAILRHVHPFQSGVNYDLDLTVHSYHVKKKVKFIVYGPTSLELIDKAEEENLIDLDTAWTYRLQALFQPSLLPPEYRNTAPLVCGTAIMRDFKQIESLLKKETLQKLKPYLVPPTHPESIFSNEFSNELRQESEIKANFSLFPRLWAQNRGRSPWSTPLKCNSAPIKVWYKKGNESVAKRACSYIDSEDMYNRFLQLMGREPPPDTSEKNNGGDGNLDIYLVPLGDDGQCISYRSTQTSPSYILINKSLTGNQLLSILAHELFHSFQLAYDQFEAEWWTEGTAVWAEDYINQQHNNEQEWLPDAFAIEENSLKTITDNEGYHPYGIYLFPFYLGKYYTSEIIGTVWKACEAQDALNAIENEVQDLKELLKDFAYKSFDLGPTEASYPDSGGPLRIFEEHWAKEKVLESEKKDYEIELELPPLSAIYLIVQNRCDLEKTPHVEFDLRGIKAFKSLTVQAIIDPDGDAKEEDWTGREKRSFCLNREEEKFEEIAIVVASSDKQNPIMTKLSIDVDAEGCVEADATIDWTIEFTRIKNHKDEYGFENGTRKITAISRAQLKLESAYVGDEEISHHYDVISWEILSVTGTTQGESESHPYPPPPDCPHITRCKSNGSVIRWEKEDGPSSLSIEYDKKSGEVKQVVLAPAAAIIYWEGETVCEHQECNRTWTTTDPFIPDWEYFPLLDWGAFKEIAENASGNIKSGSITGGGSHNFSPGEPATLQTLKANYTIKIRKKD